MQTFSELRCSTWNQPPCLKMPVGSVLESTGLNEFTIKYQSLKICIAPLQDQNSKALALIHSIFDCSTLLSTVFAVKWYLPAFVLCCNILMSCCLSSRERLRSATAKRAETSRWKLKHCYGLMRCAGVFPLRRWCTMAEASLCFSWQVQTLTWNIAHAYSCLFLQTHAHTTHTHMHIRKCAHTHTHTQIIQSSISCNHQKRI